MENQIELFESKKNTDYVEWKNLLTENASKDKAFDGYTYDPDEDYARLSTVLSRVRYLMTHPMGRWWTLWELSRRTNSSEAGVSARIRDLRKAKNGGFTVKNQRVGSGGLWQYRVVK